MVKVSIVVPTWNEEYNLPRMLQSLTPQLKTGDEIIIVDKGSEDKTLEVARRFECRIIEEFGSSIGLARHIGVEKARNEVIVSVDADAIYPADYLERMRQYFVSIPSLVAVTGTIRDIRGRLLNTLVQKQFIQYIKVGAGCNTAFRRQAYFKTKGYPDASFGEDAVIWLQLQKIGPTIYDPNLCVEMPLDRSVWNGLPSHVLAVLVNRIEKWGLNSLLD